MQYVILKQPGKAPEMKLIESNFKAIQELVGGIVTVFPNVRIPRYNADEFRILVNEEGYLLRLQPNIRINGITVVGPVVVVSTENNDKMENSFLIQEEVKAISRWLNDSAVV